MLGVITAFDLQIERDVGHQGVHCHVIEPAGKGGGSDGTVAERKSGITGSRVQRALTRKKRVEIGRALVRMSLDEVPSPLCSELTDQRNIASAAPRRMEPGQSMPRIGLSAELLSQFAGPGTKSHTPEL